MLKLFIYDKKELEAGIQKEMQEHGMSKEEATKTAKDHLKENPHYYSIADSVGLENEELTEGNQLKRQNPVKLKHIPSRTKKIKRYARNNPDKPFTVVGTSLPGPR